MKTSSDPPARDKPDSQSLTNLAPNQGAQGVFQAPVTFYQYGEIRPGVPGPEELVAALQQFLALPLDDSPDPAPLPLGSRMPFSRNPLFVGRVRDLLDLARIVKGGSTVAIGPIAAATGIGGIGKTQLASEFVHRYGQYFLGGVFWLNFADASSIHTEVASCGGTGGMNLRPDFAHLSRDEQVKLVLAAWQSPMPRLLIFDNCEDEELVAGWRPPTGGARVIVTSRRTQWNRTLNVQPLRLEVLSRQESIALLRTHRPDLVDDENLDAIAAELGDLPLALHLAGSFLETYRYASFAAPEAYLAKLRQADILNHPSLIGEGSTYSPTAHDLHVARTFMVSYEKLSSTDPIDTLALALLARAAYCAPGEPIPRDFLLATLQQDGLEDETIVQQEKAIARLLALGLLEEDEQGAVSLHRLLSTFAQATSQDTAAQSIVEELLLDVFEEHFHAGDFVSTQDLESHFRVVTDCAMVRGDEQAVKLCNQLGLYLQMHADRRGSRFYLEHALAVQESLVGKGHPTTALYLNNLGEVLKTSDPTTARAYLERAVPLWEQKRDYPNLSATLDNLGHVLSATGDYTSAFQFHKAALDLRERIFGPQSMETSTSLNGLGATSLALGDLPQAQEYWERSLAIREHLGHPRISSTLRNLGQLLLQKGEYSRALEYFERAYTISERTRGPTHPMTITSLELIATCYHLSGNNERAQFYREHVTTALPEIAQKDSNLLSSALNNQGYELWVRGNYTEARRFYEEALSICDQDFEKFPARFVVPLNNLGMVCSAMGEYEQAQDYYKRAVTIQQQMAVEKNDLSAKILNNLGVLHRLRGELEEAQQCLRQALDIRMQLYGELHRDTATTINNLGVLLQAEGDLAQSQNYIERGLSICRQLVGEEHADTARSLHDLGALLHAQGNHEKAQRHLEQALSIREQKLGDSHPDLAATLNSLGLVLEAEGNFGQARAAFDRALKIYESRLPATHPSINSLREHLMRIPDQNDQ